MKICYIASPSVHTTRWVKYFANNGYEVHLITTSKLFGNGIDNVKMHVLKRYGPQLRPVNYSINAASTLLQFKKLIREIKPDILHAQSITETTWLGAASGFHPFVVTPWGSDVLIAPKQSRISKWIVQYVLKRVDLITCDAEHMKEPLTKLGADPQKIKLIYFGTDTKKYNPERRDDKLRKELGILDSPTIISLRRLEPLYNLESLITAVPMVLREVPEAKFLIMDKGSQEIPLKELANSLGVSNSVKFLGRIPEDELPRYVASADICVSISLSDAGLAASTAEAMASGLPIITTDFGDNSKWVKDGVNGFTIPLRAPEALASIIIQLLKDEEMRKRFGKTSREIIVERNNWEKEMAKMGKLYEELIQEYKNKSVSSKAG